MCTLLSFVTSESGMSTAGGKEWSNSLLSFFRRENVYALMEFHHVHACALV